MGRARFAARAQRARKPARLVCDDPAAGRAARPARGLGALRLFRRRALDRGFPQLGLALPVLRRLCDQRRRALCAAAHRRHKGIRNAVRQPRSSAHAHRRNAEERGAECRARRLCAAGQLRAVPHGHGVPAVLGLSLHPGKSRALPADRDGRRVLRHPRHRGLGPARGSPWSPHAARLFGGRHRGVQRVRAAAA